MRHAADDDLVARQEALEHVQGEIVRAEIERDADLPVGKLLRGVNGRIRPHRNRRESYDAAAAELTAANAGVLHTAVVAPLAGIVHVGPALLEQPAVAAEGVEPLRAEHVGAGVAVGPVVGIDPPNLKSFARKQALCVGDQLRQPLERSGVLHDQRFHA